MDQFARAIEAGSLERITGLFDKDVWGIVDGGDVVQAAKRPTFGLRAVSRQWSNAKRRLGVPVSADVRCINGEVCVVIRPAAATDTIVAIVHVETRAGLIVSLKVIRDPRKVALLGLPVAAWGDASTTSTPS